MILACTDIEAGSIDSSNVEELKSTLDGLFERGVYRIVVDLEKVEFIASSGFGCLRIARDTALGNGGDIIFADATRRVREIFELLGIASILRFAPNLTGALEWMRK